jgi:multidrug efflux pump subunit AcrA (membrane-fusion protein)
MFGALNPWLLLAALSITLAAFGGGYLKGSADSEAKQAKQDLLIQQTAMVMQRAAAEEIAKIKIKNTTIKQEIQREVLEKPVYRDCRHDPSGVRLINSALDGTKSTGDLKLSTQLGATP